MTTEPASANFNHIARAYRWIEYLTFGRALERARFHFLPELAHCRNALAFGDGDGRFLAQLFAQNHDLSADAVDCSANMLHLLQKRCSKVTKNRAKSLNLHTNCAQNITFEHQYDLIITHFFLDCLTQSEVNTLASRLRDHTHHGTLWVLSEFRIPNGPLHLPAKLLIAVLYLASRWLTGLRVSSIPDHAESLCTAGFTRIAAHQSLAGILTSELWQKQEVLCSPGNEHARFSTLNC
jgi:ubiquinone/menaquinone biosynthesis C-methylase UbiE